MKNKKALKLIGALALVATVGVGATLAYLTDKSNIVTNSFTVGTGYEIDDDTNLSVWIDEKKDGEPAEGELTVTDDGVVRTLVGNTYSDVLAGDELDKDPELNIAAGSIKSYAFIEVTGLEALKNKNVTVDLNKDDWKKVIIDEGTVVDDTSSTSLDGIYMYKTMLDPTNGIAETNPLFTEVKIGVNFDAETIEQIVLKGCAVQGVKTVNGTVTEIPQTEIATPVFA